MSNPTESHRITLSVNEAQHLILKAMQPVSLSEQVRLENALDRITSDNIIAPINVPAFNNSAMDGYAFCAFDLATDTKLTLVGDAFAGHPYQGTLKKGEAIHITTGSRLPERCDTVLPYELAIFANENTLDMKDIRIKAGQHCRQCGEDLKAGDIALPKGRHLSAAELGLLASLGLATITVQRRLRVAIFSTGDELRTTGQALDKQAGAIYDSNRITLFAMLTRMGVDVIDPGVLADDPAALENAISEIAPKVDAIITSGGVSNGKADYTGQVMQKIGEIQCLSINLRPGRPFVFGKITTPPSGQHATYLFGLPGNPVAVMVSFYLFVRPALQCLNGAQFTRPLKIIATALHDIPKKIGRTDYLRGICDLSEQNQLQVRITDKQGSGMLSSMSSANCFVILESDQTDIKAGTGISVILFDGFL